VGCERRGDGVLRVCFDALRACEAGWDAEGWVLWDAQRDHQ
jgi:hypothetical protein